MASAAIPEIESELRICLTVVVVANVPGTQMLKTTMIAIQT